MGVERAVRVDWVKGGNFLKKRQKINTHIRTHKQTNCIHKVRALDHSQIIINQFKKKKMIQFFFTSSFQKRTN